MSTSPASTPRLLSYLEVPRALRALVRGREWSLIVLGAGVGAAAGLVVAAMSFGVNALHALFSTCPGVIGCRRCRRSIPHCHPGAVARRPRIRPGGGGDDPLAAAAGDRSDRSQCAARRAHVPGRQLQCRAADRLVERRWRVSRPGSRIYPACEWAGVLVRTRLSPAASRFARASGLRCGRSHQAHSALLSRARSTPSSS